MRITELEKKNFRNILECAIKKLDSAKNKKKGHWKHLSLNHLKNRTYDELLELERAIAIDVECEIENVDREFTKKAIEDECYDIINFALFIADNIRNEEKNSKERKVLIDKALKEIP